MRKLAGIVLSVMLFAAGCGPAQTAVAGVAVLAAAGSRLLKEDDPESNRRPKIIRVSGPEDCSSSLMPTFSWTVSDEHPSTVIYWLGVDTPPYIETADTSWISPPLETGNHTFYLLAIDEEGSVSDTATYDWTIVSNISNEGVTIPDLVSIPGNTFSMGNAYPSDAGSEDSELPVHPVTISAFSISTYEITNQEFSEFLNAGYFTFHHPGMQIEVDNISYVPASGKEDHPVVYVSYEAATAYCAWMSAVTGDTWRLPTEAEWEYACRGGLSGGRYPTGESIDGENANYLGSGDVYESFDTPWTTPGGYYGPNGYGIYDMAGNVWEWCSDYFSDSYYEECDNAGTVTDPAGPAAGDYRVLRGGSWKHLKRYMRCSCRYYQSADTLDDAVGFRVVKEE